MARKHEAVDLLKQGFSPSQIAKKMGISSESVLGYLYNQVGEGRIRRSDIVFSIPKDLRERTEGFIAEKQTTNLSAILSALMKSGYTANLDDLEVYLTLRDARIALGDLYEIVRDIEVTLHESIRTVLMKKFGEKDWWRKGIPASIRADCARSYEEDPDPCSEPFSYTTLINLKTILDKNWSIFSELLPKRLVTNKQDLLSRLDRLNRIRNNVMHPVKGNPPSEDDFLFARDLHEFLQLNEWMEFA